MASCFPPPSPGGKRQNERRKHMLITLTGNLGSGKSTICNIFRDSCGYETYSTGKALRGMAAERGIDILEMNKLCLTDPKYDKMIDDAVTKIADERRNDKLVFDSRLAWHFAGHSFKVFLSVALDEAANRVFNDALRGDVEKYASVEETRRDLKDRADTEDKRYRDFYNLEYFNMNNYDLVLDSTCATSEQLAAIIMKQHDRYYGAEKDNSNLILLSVNRLMYENGLTDTLVKTTPSGEIFDTVPVNVHLEDGIYKVDDGLEAIKQAFEENKTFIKVNFI